jgi:hypothetical protein
MDQPNGTMPEPPKKKGSLLKWTLIGCGGLVVLAVIAIGVAVYVASKVMATDPVKVEAAAQEILSFDMPQGFKGSFSMKVAGVKMAVLMGPEGSGNRSLLILAAMKPGSGQEAMQKSMLEAMERQGGGKLQVAEKRTGETFRAQGQEVSAMVNVVQKGGDSAQRLLQYVMTLRGAAGDKVFLMLIGNEATATHEWIQQFLDTIKSPPD